MQKRFMSDPAMAAAPELPGGKGAGGRRAAAPAGRGAAGKARPRAGESWEKQGADIDLERPECALLSNGVYNFILTEPASPRLGGLCSESIAAPGILCPAWAGIRFFPAPGDGELPCFPVTAPENPPRPGFSAATAP
jgi:hypothetical protein